MTISREAQNRFVNRLFILASLAAFLTAGPHCQSQLRSAAPDTEGARASTDTILQQMTRSAGVIFVGQVISVNRPQTPGLLHENASRGIVTVAFRVDQALRGSTSGSLYTLREWAGLWTGTAERYRPGQRLIMFLRSARQDGLTSTVHGVEGAIPLRGGGAAPGPDDTNPQAAEWLVDLRWVQAQVPRNRSLLRLPARPPVGFPNVADPSSTSEALLPPVGGGAISPWWVPSHPASPEMVALPEFLNLCRGWMRQADDDAS